MLVLQLHPQRLPGGGVALWWRIHPYGGWRLVCGETWGQASCALGELLRSLTTWTEQPAARGEEGGP